MPKKLRFNLILMTFIALPLAMSGCSFRKQPLDKNQTVSPLVKTMSFKEKASSLSNADFIAELDLLSDEELYIQNILDIAIQNKNIDVLTYLVTSRNISPYAEDRLIATTETPKAMVGEFAHLMVKSVENVGAFLDWGLGKDLFLPYAEMTRDLRMGQSVVVFLYLDKTDRIASSMRLDRYISKDPMDYKEGQQVDLFIGAETDLGFKAIINGKHWGMIYANEIFDRIGHGSKLKGYIKKVRDDGKIDLSLQKTGHQSSEDIGPLIMAKLREEGGYLPINDKTAAELIYDMFGVSKKKYKMALGGLYKQRLITVKDDGIYLNK